MKFLIVSNKAESLVNFRGHFIAVLQVKGFQVHVATPDTLIDQVTRESLRKMGVIVHNIHMVRTGMNPVSDFCTVLALWWLMVRVKPNYLLSYTIKPVIYASIAGWLAGVSNRFALITGLGYAFQGDGDRKKIQKLAQVLYKFALSHVNTVFFQNPDDLALFKKNRIVLESARVCVVNGSGVDIDYFSYSPMTKAPADSISFLMVARLLGDKGVREYVQAAKHIRIQHPNVTFKLVGFIDENPNAITQSELDEWVGQAYIQYLGKKQDVRPAIATSSVFVLPSYREGTPRSVLEAMSMGRPIITTDAPGCRETVINGFNGYLVPIKDVDALVGAMLHFIDNSSLIVKMGINSRGLAVEKYNVHAVNSVMLEAMGMV